MDKKLLLGIGLGLIVYYALFKIGKGECPCQKKLAEILPKAKAAILPDTKTEEASRSKCEQKVDKDMSRIRFISADAMNRYREDEINKCIGKPIK